jgi:3-isopropylmalate/(R)-2-methylmalate dehydratase small subunit
MQPFVRLDAIALPMAASNINTDQIIPARFLRKQRADGFGQYLFHDLRFDESGAEMAGFALNQAPYRAAGIIVARKNFGCGSSREMAVWAIADYGIRAVIAPSFGDIFFNNCVRNGLLCVVLAEAAVEGMLALLDAQPGAMFSVDLERQVVHAGSAGDYAFDVDPFNRKCLLQGLDSVDYTLQFADRIAEYEAREVP